MSNFDPLEYKKNSKANWNALAPQYHNNWADCEKGPFRSTSAIVKTAEISPSAKVLDIACGTGAVSRQVIRCLGNEGMLIGIDISRTALSIAKKSIGSNKANFFEMDAEFMGFHFMFDRIVCQYGLMFFPDANKVLTSAKKMLKTEGKIVVAVHGTEDGVPYFSSIMKPVLKYIPDIRPRGAPTVHRFGDAAYLQKVIEDAGFSDVAVTRHNFSYEAGTFEEYWADYMDSTGRSIWGRIESMGHEMIESIKREAEKNTLSYSKKCKITFPWAVLIASAH